VSFVKLVNYLRQTQPTAEQFHEILTSCSDPPWKADEYLRSAVEDDPLLQFDFDGLEADSKNVVATESSSVVDAEHKTLEYKQALDRALEDIQVMRHRVVELLALKEPHNASVTPNPVSFDNDAYFASYANLSIHEDMLKDHVRTSAYKEFIEGNPHLFKGRVMDIGCGTGVLSIFAAKCGASKVYAIDCSSIVYSAMDIVRENGLQDVVELVKDRVEDVVLPNEEKVDVIISEWMGYCLLFESMLDSVLIARDRHLKDKTQVYPNRCSLYLAGISDQEMYGKKVHYWDSVYGIKMSVMKRQCLSEAHILNVTDKSVNTSKCEVKAIDVGTVSTNDLDFTTSFELDVLATGDLHGFLLYFDIRFIPPGNEGNPVIMSTSPEAKPTHWGQTVLFLSKPHPLHHGNKIKGDLQYRKAPSDHRSGNLSISWNFNDESQFKQDWTLAR
jgi:protein arginine N-methyltransferase 3